MAIDKENILLTKDDILLLREDAALIKTDIADFKLTIIKWIVAVGIAEVVLTVLLVKFL